MDELEKKDPDKKGRKPSKPDRYGRGCNDISWYDKRNQVEEVGRISTADALGAPVNNEFGKQNLSSFQEGASTSTRKDGYTPGIITIEWMPTLGSIKDYVSMGYGEMPVLNDDAFNLKNNVTRGNSRNIDASGQEMVLYFEGVAAAAQFIEYCMKLVQACNTTVNRKNKYGQNKLARVFVRSNSVYQYLMDEKADFVSKINQWVEKFNSYTYLPNNLSIMQRRLFMTGGCYRDSGVDQGQLYVFKPKAFGILRTSENRVDYQLTDTIFSSVTEIYRFGNSIMANLEDSYFASQLVGQLRTTMGESNNFTLPFLDEQATLYINDEKEVLLQILNLTTPHESFAMETDSNGIATGWSVYTDDNGWIRQGNYSATDNLLKFHPTLKGSGDAKQVMQPNLLMNFFHNDVNSKDWMIASRLTSYWNLGTVGSTQYTYPVICGSEVVIDFKIWSLKLSDPQDLEETTMYTYYTRYINADGTYTSAQAHDLHTLMYSISLLDTMDWKPRTMVKIVNLGSTALNPYNYLTFWETQNLTSIPVSNLYKLHTVAIASEWYISNSEYQDAATR